jgi:prefoldin subunit 5
MEQYEKSGPKVERKIDEAAQDFDARIRDLKATVEAQNLELDQLRRDVRRLQTKLDRHADYLNQQKQ